MLGREFYGWRRRRAQKREDEGVDDGDTTGDESVDLTDDEIDLNQLQLEAGTSEKFEFDDDQLN